MGKRERLSARDDYAYVMSRHQQECAYRRLDADFDAETGREPSASDTHLEP